MIELIQKALAENRPFFVTRKGTFLPLPFPVFTSRLDSNFCYFLDQLEQQPLPVSNPPPHFLQMAQTAHSLQSPTPELSWRTVALFYRLESWKPDIADPALLGAIHTAASQWKESQKILWNRELTVEELKKLEELSRYTHMASLLLKNPVLADRFFTWIIRDSLPANIFIQYPWVVSTINDHLLNSRIGKLGGHKLAIAKTSHKIVTLPFEGKDISILDLERKVTFRGEWTLSIQEIFKLFKDKPKRFVDIEYFAQGISNWNAQQMGYWVPKTQSYKTIDLEQAEWWKELVPIEILTPKQAKSRYGDFINGMNWCVSARSAREFLNLSYMRCHAYLEIAIPSRDGNYSIYDFGKFAKKMPYGVVDNMKVLSTTIPGSMIYPDENLYHTTRQHVGYAFELNYYQGRLLMEEIRHDILNSRTGNMVYQVETENCGHWIQMRLEDVLGVDKVPNLFRLKLFKVEAHGILKPIFKFARDLSPNYQSYIRYWIFYPFGAWRGQYIVDRSGTKIWKSLYHTSSFWQDMIVYHPAFLHTQFERGHIQKNVDEAFEKEPYSVQLIGKQNAL